MNWYDTLRPGATWAALWSGYTVCSCRAIRKIDLACPACAGAAYTFEPQIVTIDGRKHTIAATFTGAEARSEDWLYLEMMQREWERPAGEPYRHAHAGPSPKAALVLVFWSYFETRIDRLLKDGLGGVPARVRADLLRRYSSIGSRLTNLYKIAFETTYAEDLAAVGFPDVAALITRVHTQRNEFAHGRPTAIDDELVGAVVGCLAKEHQAWIAVYNRRVANRRPSAM